MNEQMIAAMEGNGEFVGDEHTFAKRLREAGPQIAAEVDRMMLATPSEDERAKFEAVFPPPPEATWDEGGQVYFVDVWPGEAFDDYHGTWLGWQARAALAPAAPSEIEVDIEGLGCCQLQIVDGKAFMPSVTVADILRMSALAPAAACVMPEPIYLRQPYEDRPWFWITPLNDDEKSFCTAFLRADEVARLNRNPIPVELLERAAHFLEAHSSGPSIEQQIAEEIRALLAK